MAHATDVHLARRLRGCTHMALTLEVLRDTPVARSHVELVERKGIRHPDTMVEAIAWALNRTSSEGIGPLC